MQRYCLCQTVLELQVLVGLLKWFGQMSLPRELSLRDGRLIQNPIRELEQLHGRRGSYENVPVRAETVLEFCLTQ